MNCLEEDRDRRKTKAHDGEEKVTVFCPINHLLKTAVECRTFRIAKILSYIQQDGVEEFRKDGKACDSPDGKSYV